MKNKNIKNNIKNIKKNIETDIRNQTKKEKTQQNNISETKTGLKQHATEFYEIKDFYNIVEEKINCKLCPHNCLISENRKGLCGTRANIRGKFYSLVYGRPSAIHIDPIEKKPLYHFYPGKEILSIGTLGCNLFCRGCQNYDISKGPIIKLPYVEPEEIVEKALSLNIKMIAYTYNEPTIFYEYMIDIAKIARKNKIKNVIVSNGYINKEPLKKLIRYIDAGNIDLKGFTEEFYKTYANAKLSPVLDTIKTLKEEGVWIEITNLIIPGLNDDIETIEKMCDWINNNIKMTPLHFSRFFPYYKASEIEATPIKKLMEAKEVAIKKGIKYVYTGNTHQMDNTYCHNCGNTLIERNNDLMNTLNRAKIVGLIKNKCSKCNTKIPGIF
ncbi:MAG: AmmeMemoRadiSam system radical SAM enzyme [Candidatus Woesearchaeota archaeon]|nr:MAG: AmmeMemoRadiSam system radical SAM enzyme [Candidatus Woesearchaeota archaeon]